jgi:ABC-type transporter Mla maintaining outer membrane lipid asymmetry permease subunit MlaE
MTRYTAQPNIVLTQFFAGMVVVLSLSLLLVLTGLAGGVS